MSWQLAGMVAAGAGVGLGLWMLMAGPPAPDGVAAGRAALSLPARFGRFAAGPGGVRLLGAAAAGVAVLVATRWVAVAAAVAGVVAAWPRFFGAAAEQKAVITRLESLAAWVESLRDIISTGRALPEALPAASARPYPGLDRPMQDVVSRIGAQEPLEQVLRRLADDVDDPVADRAIAALVLNSRVQGRQLRTVLTGLASSTRREVDARRQVEAQRRSLRRGVQIIMVVTFALTLGMAVFSPAYSAPYDTVTGQVVLVVVVALFLGGFAWMRTLSRHRTPDRFLLAPGSPAPGSSAAGGSAAAGSLLAARYNLPPARVGAPR